MKYLKKLFGGIEMTWPRVIVSAVVIAAYTALMLLLPFTANTSLRDIGGDIPCWILFAMIIIANCPTAKEAACKTFVFFLISQPLIYIFQVPFSAQGWSLLRYYPPWFISTLLTFPGAWLGWHTRRKGVLSAVILTPMLMILAEIGFSYLQTAWRAFPHKLLSGIFCFAVILLLLAGILTEKKQRILAAILTVLVSGADIGITMRSSYSSRSVPLPETVSADGIADVQIADENTVRLDAELLKEGTVSLTAKKPCENEIRLIGYDGSVLAVCDVTASYDAEGSLLINCEWKGAE